MSVTPNQLAALAQGFTPEEGWNMPLVREYRAHVLDSVRALVEQGAAFIVNHSGGKDSSRLLGFVRENFPQAPVYVVQADTGFEHIRPVSAEDFARANAARYGLPLSVCRNPNKTYLEMVERKGKFPSPKQRQCTSDLKRDPINTWISQSVDAGRIRARVLINCTGIRAAESTQRKKQAPFELNKRLSLAKDGGPWTPRAVMYGRTVWNWMPIFEESLDTVLEWHWRTGTALHPVYIPAYHRDGTVGGYLRRLSCRVCIYSSPADLHAIYQNDREAFDMVANLEQRIGFTMRQGESLFDIIGQGLLGRTAQYGSEEAYDRPCI